MSDFEELLQTWRLSHMKEIFEGKFIYLGTVDLLLLDFIYSFKM